jgi:hypothetical protein
VVTQASFVYVVSGSSAPQGFVRTGGSTTIGPRRIDLILSERAVLLLTALWIVGVLAFALRIGLGSLQLARLLRRSSLLASREGIRIFESPDIGVPLAIGFTRPSIVVPAALGTELGEEFECIVLHESAHIRRGDAYMNACNRALQALLFFNPGVLLLLRAIAFEREAACDDWAVARSHDLAKYTTSLASFAIRGSNAGVIGAFTTSGFGRATIARINRLEDKRRNGAITPSSYPIGGFGLVLFTIALIVHAFMPAIAFASQAPLASDTIASTTCHSSEIRYLSGPAPRPTAHVPDGLRTLVRVQVSVSGKALKTSLFKTSGNPSFDRAVIDAATKGTYSPQMLNCEPLAGTYMFEAKTG